MNWIILAVTLTVIIMVGAVVLYGVLAAEQHFNKEET